jgi:ElaB/YqjD/DUF883 family membrane-anchored ribosome-binding protein
VNENLSKLERDIEHARAKLAADLGVLRSPETYKKFRENLKSEAQTLGQRITDDLKARIANNPSAALAIGAGIGWRLFKHPPIATALVGAGILGLLRTTPARIHDEEDYLVTAQQRLREQVSEAVETAKEYSVETIASARERIGDYAETARERVQDSAAVATEEASEMLERARDTVSQMPQQAIITAQRAKSVIDRAANYPDVRDQLLLGVAGLAVAAALGIAYHRREGDIQAN